jgi:hypothetical protein
MTKFHAVLIDECGDEFGATLDVPAGVDPYDHFHETYTESRVVHVEPLNARSRKAFFEAEWRRRFDDDTQDLY